MTDEEITSRLSELDAALQETTDAKQLLDTAHEKFPLNDMPGDFKGTHSLTLSPDGRLTLGVWAVAPDGIVKAWYAMVDE